MDICPNEVFIYDNQSYPVGTDILLVFVNTVGCDSIIHIVVSENDDVSIEIQEEEVCPGGSFTYNNQDYPIGTDTSFVFFKHTWLRLYYSPDCFRK